MRNGTAWLVGKGADYVRRLYESEALNYNDAGDRAAAILFSLIADLEGQGPVTPAIVQKARCELGLVAYRSERGKRPAPESPPPPTEPPAVLPFPAPREEAAAFAAEMKGARDRDERIATALESQAEALWAIRDQLARMAKERSEETISAAATDIYLRRAEQGTGRRILEHIPAEERP